MHSSSIKSYLVGVIAVIFCVLVLNSCYSPEGATHVLKVNGYTNIVIDGRSWFGCGKDDVMATAFTATSITGQQVEGAVCSGLFTKFSTIRLN